MGLANALDQPEALEMLRFKVYQPERSYWMRVPVGYSMPVSSGQDIFVISLAVMDEDSLDDFIRGLTTTSTSNMRTHLAAQRTSIRSQLNMGILATANALTSPSRKSRHVTPRPIPSSPSPKKRQVAPHPTLGPLTRKLEPDNDAAKLERLHASGAIRKGKQKAPSCDPGDVIELTSSDNDEARGVLFHLPDGLRGETIVIDNSSDSDAAPATRSSNAQVSNPAKSRGDLSYLIPPISDSESLSSLGLSCAESSSDETTRAWPGGYYCIELHNGFAEVEASMDASGSAMSWEDAVKKAFPCARRLKSATYYENRSRWFNASMLARKTALNAGKTSSGRWKVFTRQNPCEKSKIRNARKKVLRQARQLAAISESDEASEADQSDVSAGVGSSAK